MTIYLANGTKLALIARETAPAAAYKDMYHGNANLTHYGQCLNLIRNVKEVNPIKNTDRSTCFWCAGFCGWNLGAEAAAWQPGSELGAADPALGGHVLRGHHRQQPCLPHDAPGAENSEERGCHENSSNQERERVMNDPGLSGTFVNPETGDIWNEGDIYTFPRLGKTLRK